MTTHKPKIFIGSSGAGYATAKKVKRFLADLFDCYLWKDPGVWEPNKSTFDNLLRMAHYFDFGIFVATADDLTFSNSKLFLKPRGKDDTIELACNELSAKIEEYFRLGHLSLYPTTALALSYYKKSWTT